MSPPPSPRVNVVVTPEQHRLLMSIARHQNRSAASLVREMIDAAEPLMARTAQLFDLAEETRNATRETALEALRGVLADLADITGTSGQMDLLSLLSGDPSGSGAASSGTSGASEDDPAPPPPSSNTGVSSDGPCAERRR